MRHLVGLPEFAKGLPEVCQANPTAIPPHPPHPSPKPPSKPQSPKARLQSEAGVALAAPGRIQPAALRCKNHPQPNASDRHGEASSLPPEGSPGRLWRLFARRSRGYRRARQASQKTRQTLPPTRLHFTPLSSSQTRSKASLLMFVKKWKPQEHRGAP